MKSALVLLIFLTSFGFYLHFAAPSVTTGDSGEFITAAATLSVPHAPSFPLYAVFGKAVITAIPFGSTPFRCNVFSALISAGTLALLFFIGTLLGGDLLLSLSTVAAVGVCSAFWENSLVTEVFSLNTFLIVLLFFCLLKQSWLLFSFLLGLGLGNHQILVLVVPAVFVLFRQWKRIPFMILFFTIGFSIYLYLPIRSVKEPPLNWGKPTTVKNIYRTITRKDYGSLTLALGEAPKRNLSNSIRHFSFFLNHLNLDAGWPAVITGLIALTWGIYRRNKWAFVFLVAFFFSGPFFFWLGNLPFNAQSDGIVGRFLIFPVICLLMGVPLFLSKSETTQGIRRVRALAMVLLTVSIVLSIGRNGAMAATMRSNLLVLDYGRSMLRSLPPNGALYMDGGDDAFYSLAMLHFVMNQRPDVDLHDRGGLVFKNPYGDDFRSLTKEQKQERRLSVERAVLLQRPLLYSSMDENILPGANVIQTGFLLKVTDATPSINWFLISLRSLYPLAPDVYRMRALGCFFPYMRGRELIRDQQIEQGLPYFRRALAMGKDVDWLRSNLPGEYAMAAYRKLVEGDNKVAEQLYRHWLVLDPENIQALSNLGVVLERMGRMEEAKKTYETAAKASPDAADPVFNLAVLYWKEGNWSSVVATLEEVLRRKPDHTQAALYLERARQRQ